MGPFLLPSCISTSMKEVRTMALQKDTKKEVISKFRLHELDSGSPEVQIALLTERINALPEEEQDREVSRANQGTKPQEVSSGFFVSATGVVAGQVE